MTCPACQRENPTDARFCTGCGRPLELTCAGCQTANSADSRFRKACGKPLAVDVPDAGVPAPVSATPVMSSPSPQTYTLHHLAERILTSRSALAGERKQVTVLFADLKGSMELLAAISAPCTRRGLNRSGWGRLP